MMHIYKSGKHFRRILMAAAAVAAGVAVCAGCGNTSEEEDSDKIKVMASFYTMYDFAEKIGGDYVEVTDMVPAGTEPHDWEPSASDIAGLEEADVFIYNGAGMEHWAEDVLDTLGNQDLIVVEASDGIELLESSGSGESDENEDPHVWLDPENAKAEMENIKNAFVEADPENAEYYEENYETYAAKLDALDEEFQTALADVKSRNVIVAHEAFGYLCNAYDLTQVAIDGLSPDSEPDPARMEEIIEFAQENNVTTIFFEELVSSKVAETIAEEVGADTAVLNPLEGLSDEDIESGADYFSVMRENLEALVTALNA